jgi:sugar O-acyltransferase (sialic acid O-acetyltransferase NeuD family)
MNEGFIFGCSAQGRVALDILRLQFPETTWFFLDDNPEMLNQRINEAVVIGGFETLQQKFRPKLHIALGHPLIKRKIAERCETMDIEVIQAIHPSAVISPTAKVGTGVTVGAGAIINTDSNIGDFALINTGVIIEHDTVIGDYANISPRACIGGRVIIGEEAFIGSGAIVMARTRVGMRAIVGMGAVVTRNVPDKTLSYGVPAKVIKEIDDQFNWKNVL